MSEAMDDWMRRWFFVAAVLGFTVLFLFVMVMCVYLRGAA